MTAVVTLQVGTETLVEAPLDEVAVRFVLAAALGMFLGLEREWSDKSAGIRTFSLTSLAGAVFMFLSEESTIGGTLLLVGGALVIVQGILLAMPALRNGNGESLALTTSVSLLVAYGVGALVAARFVFEGVTVAVVSSLLLVLKRELHGLAGSLTREEIQSAAEFAILAFVVFPLLPSGTIRVLDVPVEPKVAWIMVVTVAGIGIVNYAVVQSYGGRGIAVTGFVGGLASSTAVVGTMLDHVRQSPEGVSYAVAAVLLADAAMALRNLTIALAFTFPTRTLVGAVLPLGSLIVGGFVVAAATTDWKEPVQLQLDSPFSLRNAFAFGAVFLVILAVGTVAHSRFGAAGLLVSAALSGLVSSAGATTTAVLLFRGGTIDSGTTTIAVLLATAASVAVKTALATTGPRLFARRVVVWSGVLVAVAGAVTGLSVALS